MPVWRAGLAFAGAPEDQFRFHHIGAARDPQTLLASLYYNPKLEIDPDRVTHLLISDPVVGTANTALDLLAELEPQIVDKVRPEHIHIVSIFMAPEGAVRILNRYPQATLHTACGETYLDEHGWVVHKDPARFIGDYGDLFVIDGLSRPRIEAMRTRGVLNADDLEALFTRLSPTQ